MGLDFFQQYSAQRVRAYAPQPVLLDDDFQEDAEEEVKPNLDYEVDHDRWHVKDLHTSASLSTWPWTPLRFIDGKDVGRTVAWVPTRYKYPIPVRLAEIGAVVMENDQGQLRRRFELVERVVSFAIDPFPWNEVESFAIALRAEGIRILPCYPEKLFAGFEKMSKVTRNRTKDEMERLEKQALTLHCDVPVLVDGRLAPRIGAFNLHTTPVVGMIKRHSRNYLHPDGLRLLYEMGDAQRTPAFIIESHKVEFVSWYVRFSGQCGETPDWGIVRLEIARHFFEEVIHRDYAYLDCLSRAIYDYRCRDANYGRAPVSIHPIQRAEESLGSLFSPREALIQHFYRLTHL